MPVLPALQGSIRTLVRIADHPLRIQVATSTLLFSGDGSGMFSSGPGGGGPLFRALDKATGQCNRHPDDLYGKW
jgi:hypothetical protein